MNDNVIENIKKNRIYFIGWLWDNALGVTGGIIFYPDICEFREYAVDTLFQILIRALREGKLGSDVVKLDSIIANYGGKMFTDDTALNTAYNYLADNVPTGESKLLSIYLALTAKTTDVFATPVRLTTGGQQEVFGAYNAYSKSYSSGYYAFFVVNWQYLKANNTIILLLGHRINVTNMVREFLMYNFDGTGKIEWVDAPRLAKRIVTYNRITRSLKPREWHSSDPIFLTARDMETLPDGVDNLALQSVEKLQLEKKRKLRLTDFGLELNREVCICEAGSTQLNRDLLSKREEKVRNTYGNKTQWRLMKGLFTGREFMLSLDDVPVNGKYICMETPKERIHIDANNYELTFKVIGVLYWNNVPVLMLLYPYDFLKDFYSEEGIDMDIGHALPLKAFMEKHIAMIDASTVKRTNQLSIFKGEAGKLVLSAVNSDGLFDDMYNFPFEKLSIIKKVEDNKTFLKSLQDRWTSQITRMFTPDFRVNMLTSGSSVVDTDFGQDYFAKFTLKQR